MSDLARLLAEMATSPIEDIPPEPQLVGQTRQGYNIYRKPNGAGGHIYITDENSAMVWDTSGIDPSTLLDLIAINHRLNEATMPVLARISDLQRLLNRFDREDDLPIYFIDRSNGQCTAIELSQLKAYIDVVGPVKEMNIPKHLAIISPLGELTSEGTNY